MNFIPVKTFDSYVTANIWLGRLQQENIVCHLQDEYSVTINPALANAGGGIKLCVTPAQLERCQALILIFEEAGKTRCPDCDSAQVEMRFRSTNLFKVLFDALMGKEETPVYQCSNCGNSFYESQTHQAAPPIPLTHE